MKKAWLFLIFASFNTWSDKPVDEISVMTLNIFGWKTMPQKSHQYAKLIKNNNIDVVAIQEGVDDWQLSTKLPTDYSRAIALKNALGQCWQHKFQIFINQCNGFFFIENGRFDLTDGPNATRTGEYAIVEKLAQEYLIVNIHWDHENEATRLANAKETALLIKEKAQYPIILFGDFNSQCNGSEATLLTEKTAITLLKSAGIDCIFIRGLSGSASVISAPPSDHPSIIAKLKPTINQQITH